MKAPSGAASSWHSLCNDTDSKVYDMMYNFQVGRRGVA